MINRLTLGITDAQKSGITDKTTELADLTKDFETEISKDELKSLSQIADGRLPFVEKSADYAVSDPEHLPAIVDVAEFQKDLKTYKDLRELVRPLRQILGNLETSMSVAGSEAWSAARAYYKMVQLNAKMGVPGAQAVYDDLRVLFESKTAEPEEEPNS